jgi:membrane protein implicated in regulation of membrane protease activity
MAVGDLLAWWNLVFLLPGIAGLCLAFLSTLGARGDDAGEHGAPGAHPEPGRDREIEPGLWSATRVALGVGRVPLALILTTLLTVYGAIGLATNRALPSMPALLPVSLAIAVFGSVVASLLVARVLAGMDPVEESPTSSFESLVGCSGTVVSLLPSAEGTARVQDHLGNVQEVRCKDLSSAPLRPGERVVVARVESEARLCLVVRVADDDSTSEKAR